VTQEFLPLLRESESGRIVNVSTTIGSLSDWKTTAVRVLSTLARLDEGRAEVAGFDVAQVSPTSLRWITADGCAPRSSAQSRPATDRWHTPGVELGDAYVAVGRDARRAERGCSGLVVRGRRLSR
jgi:hypothetical protein